MERESTATTGTAPRPITAANARLKALALVSDSAASVSFLRALLGVGRYKRSVRYENAKESPKWRKV